MTAAPVPIAVMHDKLHTLDHAREILARTEPLEVHGFTVGSQVRFGVNPGWHHGLDGRAGTDPVDAVIQVANQSFPLSKDALLEAAVLCGLRRDYAGRCPAELLEPQLNYWMREGLLNRPGNHDFQLLVAAGTGAAVTKASVRPFSNLRLLDQLIDGIEDLYGAGEILVDHKFTHTLTRTHLRLIVPGHRRSMRGTGTADDTWSTGIQLKNSLTGSDKTSIDGYLFRWVCTNGAIDTHTSSGTFTRRAGADSTDVYEWARAAVDTVLGGLEPALDAVQGLVDIRFDGDVNATLKDVLSFYRIPVADRARIIENLLRMAGDGINMYTLMAAITEIANDSELDAARVENLLRIGGDLAHTAGQRCGGCRRLIPH